MCPVVCGDGIALTEHGLQDFIEIHCIYWSQWIITKPLSGSRPVWKLNCKAQVLGCRVHYCNFRAYFTPCSCHLKSDGKDKPKIHFPLFRKQCCIAYFINRLKWLPICNKCCSSCVHDFSNTSLELCQINTPNVLPTAQREWCCLILDHLVWNFISTLPFKVTSQGYYDYIFLCKSQWTWSGENLYKLENKMIHVYWCGLFLYVTTVLSFLLCLSLSVCNMKIIMPFSSP